MSAVAQFFDTHCHLDFEAFDEDRDEVLARAQAAGVARIVVPSVGPREWSRVRALRAENIDVAIGIHPAWIRTLSDSELSNALSGLTREAEIAKACAIGECGFDGKVAADGVSFEAQARVVDAHIESAEALQLPVVLHILRAHEFALAYLAAHGPLEHGGIVHSYSGSAGQVARYVALNLHISFAGSVTRKSASKILDAVRAVPENRLLLETDAPDQTPTGANQKRNEPAETVRIATAVAAARKMSLEAIAEITTRNAQALFARNARQLG